MTTERTTTGRVREAVTAGRVAALVSDLDGVLRTFDPALWDELDAFLGAAPGTAFRAILGNPFLQQVVRGEGTHAQWREDAVGRLVDGGYDDTRAAEAVARWAATPGVVDPAVRALLIEVRSAGVPVFVFTNGTDRVREECRELGLDDVIGEGAECLLNSAELGAAKPDPEAYERAHRQIEQQLGTDVDPGEILFVDDSAGHVHAAEQFGWRAFVHVPSSDL